MKFSDIKLGETSISSLNDLLPYLDGEFKGRKKEKFLVVGISDALKINIAENITVISEKHNAYFSAADMFVKLKKAKCSGFVVSHNHPNGLPLPSNEDLELTKFLIKESKKNDILFMEHILCAKMKDGSFFHWPIKKNMK